MIAFLLSILYVFLGVIWFLVNAVRLARNPPRSARHMLIPPAAFFLSLFGVNLIWFLVGLAHPGDVNLGGPSWLYDGLPFFYFLLVPPAVGIATHRLTRPQAAPPPA